MISKTKVDVVIPAFNEEQTIVGTILGFDAQLQDCRFIIVNNGSTDRTVEFASKILIETGREFCILDEFRQGKGWAIRTGFNACTAPVVLMVDADETYPPSEVHALLNPIFSGTADMVVGDRITDGSYGSENSRAFHKFGNLLIQSSVNRMFGSNLADILSGYRAFSLPFVKTYPILVSGFELETDMTVHALDKGFRIVEVPVSYKDRPTGSESKLKTYSDGARVLWKLFNLYRRCRPLAFMGLLASFLGLSSLLSGLPAIVDWVRFGYVYHVPLAILAGSLGVATMLVLMAALILDVLADQNRRQFFSHYQIILELQTSRNVKREATSQGLTEQLP